MVERIKREETVKPQSAKHLLTLSSLAADPGSVHHLHYHLQHGYEVDLGMLHIGYIFTSYTRS